MTLDLTIAAITAETDRISVFELTGTAPLPAYKPGAHIDFDLGQAGSRSYSLIDWKTLTTPERYVIGVQREDEGDGGSRHMHGLSVGDLLSATEPKNDFELSDETGPVLLLAGGIGITPLISHATALKAAGRDYALHYTGRSAAVMGFQQALRDAHGDALHLWHDDTAPLDLNATLTGLDPATHLYVCGPKGMIEAAKAATDLPDDQIRFELFTSAATQADDGSFEVEIADGQVFTVPPGRTIIEVLEDAGVDLIYDCQRGDCGICQVDVVSGEPDHRDVVLSKAERDSGKVMQICVSRAKSPRLVLDI